MENNYKYMYQLLYVWFITKCLTWRYPYNIRLSKPNCCVFKLPWKIFFIGFAFIDLCDSYICSGNHWYWLLILNPQSTTIKRLQRFIYRIVILNPHSMHKTDYVSICFSPCHIFQLFFFITTLKFLEQRSFWTDRCPTSHKAGDANTNGLAALTTACHAESN